MQKLFCCIILSIVAASCTRRDNHSQDGPMANSIMVINPYWSNGTWVFDDPRVGLVREPFVSGIPEMITRLTADIPDARKGFRLLFSATPFPGQQAVFTRVKSEMGGTWYRSDDLKTEGWLCPALFKYFEAAPDKIFAKAEPNSDAAAGSPAAATSHR
jgi:hypothetical protein